MVLDAKMESPARAGLSGWCWWCFERVVCLAGYDTIGSLKASISPSKALIGTQLQNTFLSP